MKTDERELDDDPRVLQAARDYLADLEAGRQPDRQAYLNRCPELSEALTECLDGIDLAHAMRPEPAPMERPTEPLGDFKIVREIGRGGMGIVYEAVQLSLGRRVALKVLPFAASLDAKHLQRFKTEAHAAAQLHHAGIVPVHAVGCERGVHFYAMQIIDGRPLDRLIAEWRGQAPVASASAATIDLKVILTTPTVSSASVTRRSVAGRGRAAHRTAAQLIAQVADALEYAHDAGVVHRDIKPANLLLDAGGTVWITDFGLAQVATDAGLTQTGDVFGTLRYMSPEQASGRRMLVDHRTDVYSLGATLYEMLALQPIFPGNDRPTLLQQILAEEPRPPRQIDRSIPVELETIVLKALAKSPTDRYATAGELAADLRRFLDEKPILARRPSLVDRSRKWMRRHPSLVASAVVFLLLGVAGLAISTALVLREQSRTQNAYDRERLRAQEAEERFRLAQRSADEMIRLAEEELADQPHLQGTRKRLLESALAYYQELIELRRHDPGAQAELAATRDRVQRMLADLAVLQGAGHIHLLGNPAVHAELKLDENQRHNIVELVHNIAEQRQESFREFHRLSAEEREQRFLELAHANEAAISTILRPDQLRRLRQIALRGQGMMAIRDPEVAKKLKLDAEQRAQLRAIEGELFLGKNDGPRRGPFQPIGPPPPNGPPKKFPEQIREALERIEAILRPEQLKTWKEMFGEPVKGGLRFGPPGPFA